jgi:hypothetical protein
LLISLRTDGDVPVSDDLYVEVRWYTDQYGFNWCEATVILQGAPQVSRSARREKNGELSNPESARTTAISLAKHEFCRGISDFREGPVSKPPELAK